MTIHGAKGLEFPIVFLLGAGARFNEQSQREEREKHLIYHDRLLEPPASI